MRERVGYQNGSLCEQDERLNAASETNAVRNESLLLNYAKWRLVSWS